MTAGIEQRHQRPPVAGVLAVSKSGERADDATRYRDPELLEPWEKKDPINRFRLYLERRSLWNEADEKRVWSAADDRITETLAEVEKTPPPSLESMFEDVYAEMPWHLREQCEEALALEAESPLESQE